MLAHLLGDLVEVAAVALGQDHVGQAGRVGREHLLLEPADRQHAALQGDLAGHADGVLDGRPESSEASAVTIVTPALGPSLGIAPAGTWTWNSRSRRRSRRCRAPRRGRARRRARSAPTPSSRRRAGRSAPGRRLSRRSSSRSPRRTARRRRRRSRRGRSPRRGSRCARPTPGRTSGVRARRARPRGRSPRGPRPARTAIFVAVLRSSVPSSRSRLRTPASRVYSAMIVRSTSSEISTSSSRRPLRSRWRGHR